jgi:hypothetical protein
MLPDPRWDELPADQFVPQPCRCIELVDRKDNDVEVVTGDLTADAILPWLDGQVSREYTPSGAVH